MYDVKSKLVNLNSLREQDLNILDKTGIKKLFNHVPVGISVLLPGGNFTDVNDTFLQITGYTKEEILKIPEQILTHPDDREMNFKFVSKVYTNTMDDYELEKRYLRKDGSVCWVKMSMLVIRDSQNALSYIIAIIKDIDEEKGNTENLLRNKRMAELGKMISHLSHAIKSPLSVIEMNVNFLNKECAEKGCSNPVMTVVQKELKHIDYLIQEVLNYTRQSNPNFVRLNIREKVENIIQYLKPILKNKQIKIINKIDDYNVLADSQKIHSLFLTLIDNSVDSIGKNGLIELTAEPKDDYSFINIFVKDSGAGFDNPEFVFKPFYTTKSLGTGMGLAIAKNIVEDHHGKIELESAEPNNTIFKVSLPLVK